MLKTTSEMIRIIIPIFNPPPNWEICCLEHMLLFKTLYPHHNVEYVLVNDGSNKNLFQSIKMHAKRLQISLQLSHHKRNLGKGRAIKTGTLNLPENTACVLCVDWDFPFGVEVLDKMIKKLTGGADLVLVNRRSEYLRRLPWSRALITRLWRSILKKIFHLPFPDSQGGTKGFSQKVIPLIQNCKSDTFAQDFELLLTAWKKRMAILSLPVELRGDVRLSNFPLTVYLREATALVRVMKHHFFSSSSDKPLRPRKTVRILHADDFGMNAETNRAIKKAIRAGLIRSVSVMTDMPEYSDAVRFLKKHPSVRVGLHVNLSEGPGKTSLPWLVLRSLFSRSFRKKISLELQRQYDILQASGLKISQLDSHQHIHAFLPIFKIFCRFAEEKHIPEIRRCTVSLSALLCQTKSFPSLKSLLVCLNFMVSWHLIRRSEDQRRALYDLNWSPPINAAELENTLGSLPENSEIFCHLSDKITGFKLSKDRFRLYLFLMRHEVKKLFQP